MSHCGCTVGGPLRGSGVTVTQDGDAQAGPGIEGVGGVGGADPSTPGVGSTGTSWCVGSGRGGGSTSSDSSG
jgi:hypothetical protein